MTKNGSASALIFKKASFAISNEGAAAIAHRIGTIILVNAKASAVQPMGGTKVRMLFDRV
jgi:hypothetical protein